MINETTLNQERAELQHKIHAADALKRLKVNTDFVTVIELGYFNERMAQLVYHLGKNTDEDPKIIQALKEMGGLKRHLDKVMNDGAMAKQSLMELDAIPLSEYNHE